MEGLVLLNMIFCTAACVTVTISVSQLFQIYGLKTGGIEDVYLEGSHCEIRINICSSNPCLNGGICSPTYDDQDESYSCQCKEGFGGKNCQDVLEICSIRCMNNGTCVTNEDNDQVCVCEQGKLQKHYS